MIKAIETRYQGYRFRSRLEARWAVFFDAMGIKWEYEKEGFDLEESGYYLPDFWLPDLNVWVEIKPDAQTTGGAAAARCMALSLLSQTPVMLIMGTPGSAADEDGMATYDYRIMLFGGEAWHTFDTASHTFAESYTWGAEKFARLRDFLSERIMEDDCLSQEDAAEYMCFVLDEDERRRGLVSLDRLYYRRKYQKEHSGWALGRWCFAMWDHDYSGVQIQWEGDGEPNPAVASALAAARSARFEHGETPRIR